MNTRREGMNRIKLKTGEALFDLLSSFHEVNGLTVKGVRQSWWDDSNPEYHTLTKIIIDFESKVFVLEVSENDDTVEFRVTNSSFQEKRQGIDASHSLPWNDVVGQKFGWGWVTVNQQGYLDGVLLSFAGIIPQILITVAASSLYVSRITA